MPEKLQGPIPLAVPQVLITELHVIFWLEPRLLQITKKCKAVTNLFSLLAWTDG